jgi:hypothetical protein
MYSEDSEFGELTIPDAVAWSFITEPDKGPLLCSALFQGQARLLDSLRSFLNREFSLLNGLHSLFASCSTVLSRHRPLLDSDCALLHGDRSLLNDFDPILHGTFLSRIQMRCSMLNRHCTLLGGHRVLLNRDRALLHSQ